MIDLIAHAAGTIFLYLAYICKRREDYGEMTWCLGISIILFNKVW